MRESGPHHRSRTRTIIEEDLFDVTRTPLPGPHLPHGGAKPTVRLPGSARPKEPVSNRQLTLFRLPPRPMRWEILSWEPPVEGMSRKTLSRDEILFTAVIVSSQPPSVVVSLPKSRIVPHNSSAPAAAGASRHPRPNNSLPGGSLWTSRRAAGSDDLGALEYPPHSELDTMSRSPLAESSTQTVVSLPGNRSRAGSTQAAASPRSSNSVLARSQPKMPTGSDVAFYRTVGDGPAAVSVKFTVSSELDEPSPESLRVETEGTKSPEELVSPKPLHSKHFRLTLLSNRHLRLRPQPC